MATATYNTLPRSGLIVIRIATRPMLGGTSMDYTFLIVRGTEASLGSLACSAFLFCVFEAISGFHIDGLQAFLLKLALGFLLASVLVALAAYVSRANPMLLVAAWGIGAVLSLHRVKRLNLRIYAVFEFLFALALMGATIATIDQHISAVHIVGMVSAAFVGVRSLDNFKKDREERSAEKAQAAITSSSPSDKSKARQLRATFCVAGVVATILTILASKTSQVWKSDLLFLPSLVLGAVMLLAARRLVLFKIGPICRERYQYSWYPLAASLGVAGSFLVLLVLVRVSHYALIAAGFAHDASGTLLEPLRRR